MNIEIRNAIASDVPRIKKLIEALALYEKAPEEVTITEQELLEDGFGEKAIYQCKVAENNHELVGFALFYTAYSTWKGKYIYLDDLFVYEEYRKHGIGKKLIDEVILYAKKTNANQVRWQVLEWNELAINFYKKFPVTFDGEWINCKVYKNEIEKY